MGPLEFTATPGTSPKFIPLGSLGKSGTESKLISGTVWASAGPDQSMTNASNRLFIVGSSRDSRAGAQDCHSFGGYTASSAADLKFLHHLQQTLLETSNRKAALELWSASAPLFPKFVSERAEVYYELRKRGTSAAHAFHQIP